MALFMFKSYNSQETYLYQPTTLFPNNFEKKMDLLYFWIMMHYVKLWFFGFRLKWVKTELTIEIENPISSLDCQSQSNPPSWIAIRIEQSSNSTLPIKIQHIQRDDCICNYNLTKTNLTFSSILVNFKSIEDLDMHSNNLKL